MIKKIISFIISIIFIFSIFNINVSAENTITQIVSSKTPISSDDAKLIWSTKYGTSYKDAPTPQIVVDDYLVFMSGKMLYKVKTSNSKLVKKVEMVQRPSYSYTPPLYADGVIYCPIDNATIQAFDFKSMKSLWIYKDKSGGQSLTSITYDNGYIYTGFWNDEDANANYVCINTKDENTKSSDEAKSATWTYSNKGGFYWAECLVVNDCVVFGCDDGTFYDNKPSKIVSLNKLTGKVSDTYAIIGDQRSGIAYSSGRLFFTTKAGYLYSVKYNKNGTFDKTSSSKLSLGGASTSTPLIYNGRIYVGTQGDGFNNGYLKVIDASKLTFIYSVKTKGYPQGKMLLSNAYEKENGYINLYFTYNNYPGGITMLSDKAGQTSAKTTEIFTPDGDYTNYCISSIVSDENGTLFYKNDSGTIFAVGNKQNKVSVFQKIIIWFKKLFNIR